MVYGSSRVGSYKVHQLLNGIPIDPTTNYSDLQLELTDHLGTVRAVVQGQKDASNRAVIVSLQDVDAWGWTMQGRSFISGSKYRYGYQGSENDQEYLGAAAFITEFRLLDVRIGRWLSTDPITHEWQSPYCSMDNDPINTTDELGLEGENDNCGSEPERVTDDAGGMPGGGGSGGGASSSSASGSYGNAGGGAGGTNTSGVGIGFKISDVIQKSQAENETMTSNVTSGNSANVNDNTINFSKEEDSEEDDEEDYNYNDYQNNSFGPKKPKNKYHYIKVKALKDAKKIDDCNEMHKPKIDFKKNPTRKHPCYSKPITYNASWRVVKDFIISNRRLFGFRKRRFRVREGDQVTIIFNSFNFPNGYVVKNASDGSIIYDSGNNGQTQFAGRRTTQFSVTSDAKIQMTITKNSNPNNIKGLVDDANIRVIITRTKTITTKPKRIKCSDYAN